MAVQNHQWMGQTAHPQNEFFSNPYGMQFRDCNDATAVAMVLLFTFSVSIQTHTIIMLIVIKSERNRKNMSSNNNSNNLLQFTTARSPTARHHILFICQSFFKSIIHKMFQNVLHPVQHMTEYLVFTSSTLQQQALRSITKTDDTVL